MNGETVYSYPLLPQSTPEERSKDLYEGMDSPVCALGQTGRTIGERRADRRCSTQPVFQFRSCINEPLAAIEPLCTFPPFRFGRRDIQAAPPFLPAEPDRRFQ